MDLSVAIWIIWPAGFNSSSATLERAHMVSLDVCMDTRIRSGTLERVGGNAATLKDSRDDKTITSR